MVVVEKPQLGGYFQVSKGYPTPFGATIRGGGVYFSIYSLNALSTTCMIALSNFQNKGKISGTPYLESQLFVCCNVCATIGFLKIPDCSIALGHGEQWITRPKMQVLGYYDTDVA